MLIWLVLLHSFVHPGFSYGVDGSLGDCLTQSVCAPNMSCVTDSGCCCEIKPSDDIPAPGPVHLPTRNGVELITSPLPSLQVLVAESDAGLYQVLPAPSIEPEAHLRRLSRLCVWRT